MGDSNVGDSKVIGDPEGGDSKVKLLDYINISCLLHSRFPPPTRPSLPRHHAATPEPEKACLRSRPQRDNKRNTRLSSYISSPRCKSCLPVFQQDYRALSLRLPGPSHWLAHPHPAFISRPTGPHQTRPARLFRVVGGRDCPRFRRQRTVFGDGKTA